MTGGLRTLTTITVLLLLLAGAAFADHAYKMRRMHRAEVAWWFCENQQVGCGRDPERLEHRADRIERGWQQRERVYTVLLGMLLGAGLMAGLGALRQRADLTETSAGSPP